jgi:molybdate transport system regulatory protein
MQPRGEPFLEFEDVTVDERDVAALRAIDEHGSMNRAASALGRSYARIQQRVAELEETLGPLVTRQRGGAGGGGSTLTEAARDLVGQFDRLRAEFSGLARSEESVFAGRVVERTETLGLVETGAGVVRSIVSGGSDDVQVSVRSDAVVLTSPEAASSPDDTSVRNQFRGTVRAVERDGGVARVTVDVAAETPLCALVTETSIDKLGLSVGDPVVASFKATATRAIPRPTEE